MCLSTCVTKNRLSTEPNKINFSNDKYYTIEINVLDYIIQNLIYSFNQKLEGNNENPIRY